jgi:hypothetical protein
MAGIDKVFEIVKTGPVLPVEIASKLKVDSFIAKAFLEQLVETGKVKTTQEKIGDAFVYFVPGHEMLANTRMKKLLENIRPTAKNFAPASATAVAANPEVEKKRAEFKARLEEIEKKEKERAEERKLEKKAVKIPVKKEERPKEIPKAKPETKGPAEIPVRVEQQVEAAVVEVEEASVKTEELKEEKPKVSVLEDAKRFITGAQSTVVESAETWLMQRGAEIHNKELKKRGKEAIILASIPTNIDPMKFLVFVLNKKSVSEADLSVAYSEGVQKKYPVIVMSRGKMTKLAQNYLSVISGVVKFKQLD